MKCLKNKIIRTFTIDEFFFRIYADDIVGKIYYFIYNLNKVEQFASYLGIIKVVKKKKIRIK